MTDVYDAGLELHQDDRFMTDRIHIDDNTYPFRLVVPVRIPTLPQARRLTDGQVGELRRKYTQEATQAELAATYGVGQPVISRPVNAKRRRRVEA